MQAASLRRVKRREKILVILAFAAALSVYCSAPSFSAPDLAMNDAVMGLQPIGADGRLASLLAFRALYELMNRVFGSSLGEAVGYSAAVFSALACALTYFIYRELFGQRYVGVVALALVGSAPAIVLAAKSGAPVTVAFFLVALAVLAWLQRRWTLWGIAWGLALAAHIASAALVLPLLGWVLCSRRLLGAPWRIVAGALAGGVIVATSYGWAVATQGGFSHWANERVPLALRGASVGLPALGLPDVAYAAAYGICALALGGLFRNNRRVLAAVLPVFTVGAPVLFLLWVNIQPLFRSVGALIWTIAFVSVLPLWITDVKKRELTFLLLWFAPLAVLVTLVARGLDGLFVFLTFPLALLSCRLLDRTADGEWLDLWWVLGLPTEWYYRLSKAIVVIVLALSFVQASRLSI